MSALHPLAAADRTSREVGDLAKAVSSKIAASLTERGSSGPVSTRVRTTPLVVGRTDLLPCDLAAEVAVVSETAFASRADNSPPAD
jgi:hypothetical protein